MIICLISSLIPSDMKEIDLLHGFMGWAIAIGLFIKHVL